MKVSVEKTIYHKIWFAENVANTFAKFTYLLKEDYRYVL